MPCPYCGITTVANSQQVCYNRPVAAPSSRLNRRSVRLPGFDYSQTGQYFVTICAFQKECLFGRVVSSRVDLNDIGEIVHGCWVEIPIHFPQVTLDAFVVMPNHIHGIVTIQMIACPRPLPSADAPDPAGVPPCLLSPADESDPAGARHAVPLRQPGVSLPESHRPEAFRRPVAGSLATIVRSYKSAVTRQVRTIFRQPEYTVWQRGFYESVLRSGKDYGSAARYILENPRMWHIDAENPRAQKD